ncbi:DUF805 domain-containing protein [Lysobacter sp. TY2-98]|uniref:DUF805 domain-containing protein n=1 Tax=Lysobacter sp. TY2-98 TaxID=2290922 RepID=UPI001965F849|nr:DUF805 domain-containing protein [Lysobacter sp. TY2-98]
MPLRRYADFSGRSRRKEYWMFVLFHTLLLIVMVPLCIAAILATRNGDGSMSGIGIVSIIVVVLVSLALIVPSLAVQARRFHDQDKSGWLVLLNLIPSIGGLIVLVMLCMEGTYGANRYGPDPKVGEPGH